MWIVMWGNNIGLEIEYSKAISNNYSFGYYTYCVEQFEKNYSDQYPFRIKNEILFTGNISNEPKDIDYIRYYSIVKINEEIYNFRSHKDLIMFKLKYL